MKQLLTGILILFVSKTWAQTPSFVGVSQYELHGASTATDKFGSRYTTGVTTGTMDFDPGSMEYYITDHGFGDWFISKLDSNGKFQWAMSFGSESYDLGKSIAVDDLGYVYVIGTFNTISLDSLVDFDPGPNEFFMNSDNGTEALLKLDSEGNFIWVKQFYSIGLTSLALDPKNNIVITGEFTGIVDYNPNAGVDTLESTLPYGFHALKLDQDGNYIWAKQIETIATRPHSIATDSEGSVYISGILINQADFDPSAAVYNMSNTSTTSFSQFICKLDSIGNFKWVKKLEYVECNRHDREIIADLEGNVYLGGIFYQTTDLDPNAGTHILEAIPLGANFVLKLDKLGNFNWVNQQVQEIKDLTLDKLGNIYTSGGAISKFHTDGTNEWILNSDLGEYITVDPFGTIYTFGNFSGAHDFDPSLNEFNITSDSLLNEFTLKLKQENFLGLDGIEKNIAFNIFPNPSNGQFNFQSEIMGNYKIINSLGQIIKTIKVEDLGNKIVDLREIKDGLYYLIIDSEGIPSSKKLVIKH